MFIDIPMLGNSTRQSWMTCCTQFVANGLCPALFNGTKTSYGQNVTAGDKPSVGTPWWWQVDFQTAKALEGWTTYAWSYLAVPKDGAIYGSATGAFAGEESLVQSFSGVTRPYADSTVKIPISSPQSFRHFRLVATAVSFRSDEDPGTVCIGQFTFLFETGENGFDTVTDYVSPGNKIESTGWTWVRRKFVGTIEEKFKELACMFIEDFGWDFESLADSPDKFLLKSNGKDSDRPYGYLVGTITASIVSFAGYGYWDSETETGSLPLIGVSSSGCYFDSTLSGVACCGNRGQFFLYSYSQKAGAAGGFSAGHLPDSAAYRPAHTTITSDVLSGVDLNVPVTSSNGFKIGAYCCMWGADDEGRDFGIRVTAIPDDTHVTVDNIPRDYSAGSFIGNHPQTFYWGCNGMCNLGQRSKSGLVLPSTGDRYSITTAGHGYGNPNGLINLHTLMPVFWLEALGADPGVICIQDDHVLYPPSGSTYFDVFLIGEKIVGTATGATSRTLTDTSKTWVTDEHAGKFVYISAGSGLHAFGNFARIVSNTSNTLTIGYDWLNLPSADDTYHICEEIWQNSSNFSGVLTLKCGA